MRLEDGQSSRAVRHLILGGTGFIGSHVAAQLVAQGADTTVASRRGEPTIVGAQSLNLSLDDVDWAECLADYDVIHHYAWATVPQSAHDDPIGDLDLHVRSTLKLLEAAKKIGGKRMVFASSGGTIYGHLERVPARESDLPRPIGIYGAAKLAVENYMGVYHRHGHVDCRVARLANPYGIGAVNRQDQGLVSIFARKAVLREPMAIWGDGEVVRDYIHVLDVADALCRLATAALADATSMPIFNIGSGVGISINEIINILERQLQTNLELTRKPGRAFDVPVSVLDISHANASLGWTPRMTIEAGIALMLADLSEMLAPQLGTRKG